MLNVKEMKPTNPTVTEALFNTEIYIRGLLSRNKRFILFEEEIDELRKAGPYVFKGVENAEGYILLNREYSHICESRRNETQTKANIDLCDVRFRMACSTFSNLIYSCDDLRLYNDMTAPWNSWSDMIKYHTKLVALNEALCA